MGHTIESHGKYLSPDHGERKDERSHKEGSSGAFFLLKLTRRLFCLPN